MPKIHLIAQENGYLAQTEGKQDLLITPADFACSQLFVTGVGC